MCYSPYIWYYKYYLYQNFIFILTWKINKKMNKYIKNKNQILIILIIKFEDVIVNNHINKWSFVGFNLFG